MVDATTATPTEDDTMTKTIEQITAIIKQNIESGKDNRFEGLTSSEIGTYNRHQMFGGCSAEDWDENEWSAIVD
jgi:hypothetical protein